MPYKPTFGCWWHHLEEKQKTVKSWFPNEIGIFCFLAERKKRQNITVAGVPKGGTKEVERKSPPNKFTSLWFATFCVSRKRAWFPTFVQRKTVGTWKETHSMCFSLSRKPSCWKTGKPPYVCVSPWTVREWKTISAKALNQPCGIRRRSAPKARAANPATWMLISRMQESNSTRLSRNWRNKGCSSPLAYYKKSFSDKTKHPKLSVHLFKLSKNITTNAVNLSERTMPWLPSAVMKVVSVILQNLSNRNTARRIYHYRKSMESWYALLNSISKQRRNASRIRLSATWSAWRR